MPPQTSLLSARWTALVASIARVVDLEATARQFKALQRRRKIRSAEALLRLALIWGPGQQSLREAAALAADSGIADMSDKAVEGRLRKMGDWLAHILLSLLTDRLGHGGRTESGDLAVSLVDGSLICSPGKGADWRLHARYDPDSGRFTDLVVTSSRVAEAASHTRVSPGRTVIMDCGYARATNFKTILADGGNFICRTSWSSVKLFNADGERIDVIALLEGTTGTKEVAVRVKGVAAPLRLVIKPLPEEAAERQRARRRRKANRRCQRINPHTLLAAGFLMLITSHSVQGWPAEEIAARYRDRWQVEIGFKRMKTLGGLDELPTADPVLARTWLLAHLIAAVLTDDLANEIAGFSPSAGRGGEGGDDAMHALAGLEEGAPDPAGGDFADAQAAYTRRDATVSAPAQ